MSEFSILEVVIGVLLTSSVTHANYKNCPQIDLIHIKQRLNKRYVVHSCWNHQLAHIPEENRWSRQYSVWKLLNEPRSHIYPSSTRLLKLFKEFQNYTTSLWKRFFTASPLQIKHGRYLSYLSACRHTPHIETPAFLSCHSLADWN